MRHRYKMPSPVPFKRLKLEEMPSVTLNKDFNISMQIAAYLRKILWRSNSSNLKLPSIVGLSGFFNCSEIDVLGALQNLKTQNYHYELNGLDTPVTLQDPLQRENKKISQWESIVQQLNLSHSQLQK